MILSFRDTATPEIYTLSLHDALPICPFAGSRTGLEEDQAAARYRAFGFRQLRHVNGVDLAKRRESGVGPQIGKHTSELQSQSNLVCRLLLEKKKSMISAASTMTGILA